MPDIHEETCSTAARKRIVIVIYPSITIHGAVDVCETIKSQFPRSCYADIFVKYLISWRIFLEGSLLSLNIRWPWTRWFELSFVRRCFFLSWFCFSVVVKIVKCWLIMVYVWWSISESQFLN